MKRRIETLIVEGMTIEYSVVGEGTPILVMHGGHSSCNEEFGYRTLVENGFSIITPSRAGYGNTSKAIGKDLSTACRFYSALLHHLKIKKVHLIAFSAGGPSGIYFASNYPEQVITFTLQSAVTKEWLTPVDKEYKAAQILFRPTTEKYVWKLISFMSNIFPRFIFKQMAPSFSKLRYDEVLSRMKEEDIEEIRKMNNRQRSGDGFFLDLAQSKNISTERLQSISCPTLIMHSSNDGAVPIDHVNYAHQNIPSSEICLLDTWGHLIWLGITSDETNKHIVKFLTSNNKR